MAADDGPTVRFGRALGHHIVQRGPYSPLDRCLTQHLRGLEISVEAAGSGDQNRKHRFLAFLLLTYARRNGSALGGVCLFCRESPFVKRISNLILVAALIPAACVSTGPVIRPLHPLEIATGAYQDMATKEMTGTFMYEGQCLSFRDEASRQLFVPVWPVGTEFNGTSVIFHLPGKADSRVVMAEETHVSGNPLTWEALAPDVYAPFRVQCGARPFFVSGVRPAN